MGRVKDEWTSDPDFDWSDLTDRQDMLESRWCNSPRSEEEGDLLGLQEMGSAHCRG
jgi:hypothetical protein